MAARRCWAAAELAAGAAERLVVVQGRIFGSEPNPNHQVNFNSACVGRVECWRSLLDHHANREKSEQGLQVCLLVGEGDSGRNSQFERV